MARLLAIVLTTVAAATIVAAEDLATCGTADYFPSQARPSLYVLQQHAALSNCQRRQISGVWERMLLHEPIYLHRRRLPLPRGQWVCDLALRRHLLFAISVHLNSVPPRVLVATCSRRSCTSTSQSKRSWKRYSGAWIPKDPESRLWTTLVSALSLSLAAWAQTSRAFHDPALDVLWHFQTLDDLLRCLPGNLALGQRVGPHEKQATRLLRLMVAEDWNRVRIHVRHIRTLSCHHITSSDMISTIIRVLPRNLFPKLRAITCGRFHLFLMEDLLGPAITKFNVHLPKHSSASRLSSLASTRLEYMYYDGRDLCGEVSQAVCGLHHLETIEVYGIDWQAIQHLGRLQSLALLRLPQLPSCLLTSSDVSSFSSLTKLWLGRRVPVTSTIHLLKLFRNPPLTALDTTVDVAPTTAAEAHTLFSALATGCSHNSLTSLQLACEEMSSLLWDDPYLLSAAALHVLLCFSKFTVLSIQWPLGIDLDDGTVSDLARAWARVEYLLLTSLDRPVPPRTTLRCLCSFAEHCPRLQSLEIILDASDVPVPDNSLPPHHLFSLDVSYSPITSRCMSPNSCL
ncbi:hypothetical protein C8R43DRAFT_1135810 [Mycena crocata]|nr:hypothetical protein C8R43DRAFT_1135810 [Mycena crocata]